MNVAIFIFGLLYVLTGIACFLWNLVEWKHGDTWSAGTYPFKFTRLQWGIVWVAVTAAGTAISVLGGLGK